MTATFYQIEWRFGGGWSRLHWRLADLTEARQHAQTVFLPPTKAESRPATRIVRITEEVIES